MKFFLDFEATRFNNRIISIGCIAENGSTYYSLVYPGNKVKIDNFIIALTGITRDDLKTAPSADQVFGELYDFVKENCKGRIPYFYVYGNCDANFLENTINKNMKNFESIIFARSILSSLIDYSVDVKNFFDAKTDIALKKVHNLILCREETTQNHNALEDAKMLKTVVEGLNKCHAQDIEILNSMPAIQKPNRQKPKAPEYYNTLKNQKKKMWVVDTGYNAESAEAKYIACPGAGNSTKRQYFSSLEEAAMWVLLYNTHGPAHEPEHVRKVMKTIEEKLDKNKNVYSVIWKRV